MRTMKTLLMAAAATVPFFASPVAAQSIDYGALETLFGEAVTTSANGSPQRSTEVPVDMTILSAEDIRRSGAMDLPTLLGRVAGLDVMAWSTLSADIGVRGYNQPMSPRLLVLINGRQVYLDHYGYTAWSTLPVQMSEIRQIEVVKGPNAALFGFNAVSGVVNIITYNPKYDSVSGGSVTMGSRNRTDGSLYQTFRLSPTFSARLSAGATKADEWNNSLGSSRKQYRSEVDRVSTNFDAVWSVTEKSELRLEASAANAYVNDMLSTFDATASKYKTTSIKAGLTSDTQFGLITATAYQNKLKHKLNIVYADGDIENTITNFSLQNLFKIGSAHTVRLGLESRQNELNTAPVKGGKISYDVMSVSAMWNWAISDALTASAALRNDSLSLERSGTFAAGFPLASNSNWDRDISKVSYNLGVVWRMNDKATVKFMAARGAQLPSLVELGGLQLYVPSTGFNIAFMGNPGLEPSVADNIALSYDRSFENLKLGVRVFSQKTEAVKGQPASSAIFKMPTLTTLPAVSWLNVSDSEMTGFEISAKGHFAQNVHWSADYTATDVEDTGFAGRNLIAQKALYSEMTPDYRANFNIGWANDKWSLDAYVHSTGAFKSHVPGTYTFVNVPASTSLAANVSYEVSPMLRLSLSALNYGDAKEQTTGLRSPSSIYVTLSSRW